MAACALAAIAPRAASASEVAIGGGSNPYYTVNVMSWWEIPFRTVVRQRYDFSCGSAALATLLTYQYDKPTNETMTFSSMWNHGDQEAIRTAGFSMLDMRNYLNTVGLRAEGFRFDIEDLKKVRRPGIALMNLNGYKHFVVIKGITNTDVLVGDPMLGLKIYPMAEFAKHWNGILLAIVDTPDKRRPTFNLASDWAPWSKAPIDLSVETDYTTDSVQRSTAALPPTYQFFTKLFILESGVLK
jgi:predicted double-glycine peptidase